MGTCYQDKNLDAKDLTSNVLTIMKNIQIHGKKIQDINISDPLFFGEYIIIFWIKILVILSLFMIH